jgi:2-polyprenyl-6-methoxyphenol hydroxylase-like FAD-dependent oxidoreductase
MAETWGRGSVFGIMPLADGRVYCYAAAPAERGDRARGDGGELADLVRRFGGWHEPIPSLLARATTGDVLRHDVAELARPLSSFHQGKVALLGDAAHPMTPNLGQGACQALEDAVVLARLLPASAGSAGSAGGGPSPADSVEAALAAYSAARMDRTRYVVRWSRRAGTMTTWTSPMAVALRDGLATVMGRLNPGAALRGLDKIYDWQPPALRFPGPERGLVPLLVPGRSGTTMTLAPARPHGLRPASHRRRTDQVEVYGERPAAGIVDESRGAGIRAGRHRADAASD